MYFLLHHYISLQWFIFMYLVIYTFKCLQIAGNKSFKNPIGIDQRLYTPSGLLNKLHSSRKLLSGALPLSTECNYKRIFLHLAANRNENLHHTGYPHPTNQDCKLIILWRTFHILSRGWHIIVWGYDSRPCVRGWRRGLLRWSCNMFRYQLALLSTWSWSYAIEPQSGLWN